MVHPHADQRIVEGGCQATQIGILRQGLNQGLGFAEFLGEADDLLSWQEQQPVLCKERPSASFQNRVEVILLGGQFLDQRRRRLGRQFRGRSIDDREDRFFFRGKRFFERHLTLPPWQLLGNELVHVGVDGEMAGRINAGDKTQKDRDAYDLRRVARATINNGDDRPLQHG